MAYTCRTPKQEECRQHDSRLPTPPPSPLVSAPLLNPAASNTLLFFRSLAQRPRSILMGHSMGCITAATAAVDPSLPADQTTLILVAPALRRPSKKKNGHSALNAEAGPTEESALRGGSGRPAGNVTQKGAGIVLGALIGAPVRVVRAVRDTGAWIFNWGLLPLFYPVEILALR